MTLSLHSNPLRAAWGKTTVSSYRTIKSGILFSSLLALASCGGGGNGGSDDPSTDLQGTWLSDECTVVSDSQSERGELIVNGNSLTQTRVLYNGNQTCSGDLLLRTSLLATINVSGESTDLADGPAKHIDIFYSKGVVTASETFLAILTAQGTTLQDRMAAEGVADINNIPVSSLRERDTAYSIYRVDGNLLRIGTGIGEANDGSAPELRANKYSRTILTKQ